MLKKVLIANRGEIAARIIDVCKELRIKTVAIYSEADKDAIHVKQADEAYCIGPASAKDSYLNMESILKAALLSDADGIHPGYGFLAENDDFASLCAQFGISFIGPPVSAIQKMGIKDAARKTMQQAGVPVTPGSDGLINNFEDALSVIDNISFPVIIKATAGGGGKGIRVAKNEQSLKEGIEITKKEATTAFGNPGIYIEKFIEDFRHIEVQILADQHGNVVHLGERDCTVQRRMQKLLEESPSPVLDQSIRDKMGQAAVKAAQAVDYVGAGTVEFIYEHKTKQFYFMEMNTRIQVEHPITEMVTGIDLIKEQLKIASGYKLEFKQSNINLSGWSIECRINAEDPNNNFMPSPGTINRYNLPGGFGVRTDSAVYSGYTIPPFYDSLIAKLIVHGNTRNEAIAKMKRALDQFEIEGVKTTIPFFQKILEDKTFINGDFNTNYADQFLKK